MLLYLFCQVPKIHFEANWNKPFIQSFSTFPKAEGQISYSPNSDNYIFNSIILKNPRVLIP